MTDIQKLQILLQKAVENGWEDLHDLIKLLERKDSEIYPYVHIFYQENNVEVLYSLNDLVFDCEPGKVSFIEALCRADLPGVQRYDDFLLGYEGYESPYVDAVINITLGWLWDEVKRTIRPASERLEYLFEVFKDLLV